MKRIGHLKPIATPIRWLRVDHRILFRLVISKLEKAPNRNTLGAQDFQDIYESFLKDKLTSKTLKKHQIVKEIENKLASLNTTDTLKKLKDWYSSMGFVYNKYTSKIKTSSDGPVPEKVSFDISDEECKILPSGIFVNASTGYPAESRKFLLINYDHNDVSRVFKRAASDLILSHGGKLIAELDVDLPENRDAFVVNFGPWNQVVIDFLNLHQQDIYKSSIIFSSVEENDFQFDQEKLFVSHLHYSLAGGNTDLMQILMKQKHTENSVDTTFLTKSVGCQTDDIAKIQNSQKMLIKQKHDDPMDSESARENSSIHSNGNTMVQNDQESKTDAADWIYLENSVEIRFCESTCNQLAVVYTGDDEDLRISLPQAKLTNCLRNTWLVLKMSKIFKDSTNAQNHNKNIVNALYEFPEIKPLFPKCSRLKQEITRFVNKNDEFDEMLKINPVLSPAFIAFMKEHFK